MLRTGPRFRVEERRDCALIWNVRDFSMPKRMVASFPGHPYDKNEAAILAEICAAALNSELPGLVAPEPEAEAAEVEAQSAPESSAPVNVPWESPQASPRPAPPRAPQPQAEKERRSMPKGWENLKGADKVKALSNSLFGDEPEARQEVS